MIVVDTSALIEMLFNEPKAMACRNAVRDTDTIFLSAGTMTEAMIVAGCRDFTTEMLALIDGMKAEIINVTPATARRIGQIHVRWGKGMHPAGLNFGDCFAYEAAQELGCALLYVGDDFAKTDVRSALA